MIEVSIICPIYNGSRNLATVRQNIYNLEESSIDYELIIIDDGSRYEEAEILAKWSQELDSPRVSIYFLEENSGPGSARNLGLKKTTKEYTLFLDADDSIDAESLSKLLTTISKENGADMLRSDFSVNRTDFHGGIRYTHSNTCSADSNSNEEELLSFLEFRSEHSVLGCIFKTQHILDCAKSSLGLFPAGLHEDVLFWWRVLLFWQENCLTQCYSKIGFYTKVSTKGSIVNTISHTHLEGYLNNWSIIGAGIGELLVSGHEIEGINDSYSIGSVALVATRLREIIRHEQSEGHRLSLLSSLIRGMPSPSIVNHGLHLLSKRGLKTQYSFIAEALVRYLEGGRSESEQVRLLREVSSLSKKKWSCQYIQDSLFLRANEVRTCCKRFFVDGEMKGDIALEIGDLNQLSYKDILEAKSRLVMGINSGAHDCCTGCPFLEFRDWKPLEESKLKYISIENHSICNMRCSYCSSDYWGGAKPNYSLRQLIDSLNANGQLNEVDMVVWGGGEPTLGPEFDRSFSLLADVCKKATQRVITNSSRYSDEVALAVAEKKAQIITSIDAGTHETFQKIRGSRLMPDVISNLRRYSQAGHRRITAKYILDERNYHDDEIQSFVELMCINGLTEVNFQISADFKGREMPLHILRSGIMLMNHLITRHCRYVYFDDLFIARLPSKPSILKLVNAICSEDSGLSDMFFKPSDKIIIWGAGQQSHLLRKHTLYMNDLDVRCYIDDVTTNADQVAFGNPFKAPKDAYLDSEDIIFISAVQGYALIREKLSMMGLEANISKKILI